MSSVGQGYRKGDEVEANLDSFGQDAGWTAFLADPDKDW